MPYQTNAQPIHNHILNAQNILLMPHENPDGDSLSSVCAFIHYLRHIGKKHTALSLTSISSTLEFIPHTERVSLDQSIVEREQFDVVCTFDSGELYRAIPRHFFEKLPRDIVVINFDHHITNTGFGKHNLIDTDASSTTMVLYNYFLHNNIPVDATMATCLLTGLMTDTESFTNGATKSAALDIGSALVSHGADMDFVQNHIQKDKTMAGLRFWSVIFSRLYYNPRHDIAITYARLNDLERYPIKSEELEGVSNFLKMIKDANVVLFLKELPGGKIKGSLRTTGTFDCAALAGSMGGGGHKKASGFTVEGVLEEYSGGIRAVGTHPHTAILNDLLKA